jgi:hypothetical protein
MWWNLRKSVFCKKCLVGESAGDEVPGDSARCRYEWGCFKIWGYTVRLRPIHLLLTILMSHLSWWISSLRPRRYRSFRDTIRFLPSMNALKVQLSTVRRFSIFCGTGRFAEPFSPLGCDPVWVTNIFLSEESGMVYLVCHHSYVNTTTTTRTNADSCYFFLSQVFSNSNSRRFQRAILTSSGQLGMLSDDTSLWFWGTPSGPFSITVLRGPFPCFFSSKDMFSKRNLLTVPLHLLKERLWITVGAKRCVELRGGFVRWSRNGAGFSME